MEDLEVTASTFINLPVLLVGSNLCLSWQCSSVFFFKPPHICILASAEVFIGIKRIQTHQ